MFKSKVFAKYFASYIVLLITVFTVLVAVFAYAFSFTRSTVEDSVLNQFEQIGQYFEGKISELKNTADLMCNNEYLTHYKLSNAGPMAINGIKELRKIRVSNSFINDLFICYKDNFIYCQRGKASMDVYLDKMLHLDETSVSRTEEAVLHSTGSEMHPLNMVSGTYDNQPEYLLCTYPISSNNRSIGTIGFIVSQDTLKKALTSMLGEHGVGVRMLLPTGEVISEVNQSGVEHLFDGGYDGEYMYYSHTIDAPAFSFSVAIDSRSVFSYVKRLKTWSYSAVIVVFASSILLSYVFSRKHYKPIKMLRKQAVTENGGVDGDADNEFDAILKVINHNQAEKKSLLKRLEDNSFVLRQQACGLLFSGVFHDDAQVKNLIKLSGIKVNGSYFSVMIAAWAKNTRKTRDASDIFKQLDDMLGGYFVTSIMNKNSVAFVIGLKDWDTGRKERKAIAKNMREYFEAEGEDNVSICFGRVYDDISFISSSYREAVICVEKCEKLGEKRREVFFESLASMDEYGYCFDEKSISKLIKSLESRDLKRSNQYFNEIMVTLGGRNLPPEVQMFHQYDLLHQLFHHFKEDTVGAYIAEIVRIDCLSTELFSMHMKKLFRLICNRRVREMHEDIIGNIINYIEDNYSDNDLSLAFLARKFHISHNYISRYFKEKTGENYIQYLSKLRMKKAYELICNTDMQIADVASKVGYLDPVNFTKKFKKAYQVTPTELRLRKNECS